MPKNKIREHHYVFAHRLLPAMFYSHPKQFTAVLAAYQAPFLRFLWKLARGEGIRAFLHQVSAKGLHHEIRKLDDETTAILIVLPQPKRRGEAFFVATIHRPRTRDSIPTRGGALTRYVTLEYGFRPDLSPRTVLCEWATSDKWKSDIRHINYGDGPEPTLHAFYEAIQSLVEDRLVDYGKARAVTNFGHKVDEINGFETYNLSDGQIFLDKNSHG